MDRRWNRWETGKAAYEGDWVAFSAGAVGIGLSLLPPAKWAYRAGRLGRRAGRLAAKGGAQTGARTLQYWDFEGAEKAYAAIRSADDVADIARHTGWRADRIQRVKDHLFSRSHQLDDGLRRFDADPAIANAWRRLQGGAHTDADIQLLKHELFESRFEGIFRTNYRTAHDAANRSGRPSGL